MGLDPFPEFAVFLACARHHTDEPPTALINVVHGLAGTEFGVGDIKKTDLAGGATEGIPGMLVGA